MSHSHGNSCETAPPTVGGRRQQTVLGAPVDVVGQSAERLLVEGTLRARAAHVLGEGRLLVNAHVEEDRVRAEPAGQGGGGGKDMTMYKPCLTNCLTREI